MKKLIYIFTLVLLALLLVSCKNTKNVKVTIDVVDDVEKTNKTQITLKIFIADFDSQLKGRKLDYVLLQEDDKEKTSGEIKFIDGDEFIAEHEIVLKNLNEDNKYYLTISGNVNGENINLVSKEQLKTLSEEELEKVKEIVSIDTVDDFLEIFEADLNKNYKLKNDLDFSNIEVSFRDLGNTKTFSGEFDGNGKTIKNLNVLLKRSDETTSINFSSAFGIFGRLGTKGTIKDLTIENVTLGTEDNPITRTISTSTNLYYGLVVSHLNSANSEISNVNVINSEINIQVHESPKASAYIGLVAGAMISSGTVKDVEVTNSKLNVVNTQTRNLSVGGVLGSIHSSGTGLFENIYTDNLEVNVELNHQKEYEAIEDENNKYNVYVGGLLGNKISTSTPKNMKNLVAKVDVNVVDNNVLVKQIEKTEEESKYKGVDYNFYVGGVAGNVFKGEIANVYFEGVVNFSQDFEEVEIEETELEFIEIPLNKKYNIGLVFGRINQNFEFDQYVVTKDAKLVIEFSDDLTNEQPKEETLTVLGGVLKNGDFKYKNFKTWYALGTTVLNGAVKEDLEKTEGVSLEDILEVINSEFLNDKLGK